MRSSPHSEGTNRTNPAEPVVSGSVTPRLKGKNHMTKRMGRESYSGNSLDGLSEASAELRTLGQAHVIGASTADVGTTRERVRQRRLLRLGLVLLPIALLLGARMLLWGGGPFALPHFPHGLLPYLPAMVLILLLGTAVIVPLMGAGRSPHVLYRPSEIDVRFDDVRGAGLVVDEVVKTLNLFLGHRTFTEHMGGSPRRALLFEGPPG